MKQTITILFLALSIASLAAQASAPVAPLSPGASSNVFELVEALSVLEAFCPSAEALAQERGLKPAPSPATGAAFAQRSLLAPSTLWFSRAQIASLTPLVKKLEGAEKLDAETITALTSLIKGVLSADQRKHLESARGAFGGRGGFGERESEQIPQAAPPQGGMRDGVREGAPRGAGGFGGALSLKELGARFVDLGKRLAALDAYQAKK